MSDMGFLSARHDLSCVCPSQSGEGAEVDLLGFEAADGCVDDDSGPGQSSIIQHLLPWKRDNLELKDYTPYSPYQKQTIPFLVPLTRRRGLEWLCE